MKCQLKNLSTTDPKFARTGNSIILYALCLFTLVLSAFGCWYSFSERAYPQIKSVGVIPFDNQTGEYELASLSTEMMIQKIMSTGTYKLLSIEEADGIVSGIIMEYERKVNTYDETENPLEYIVRIRAKISFGERVSEKQIWEQIFEGYSTFPPDGDESQAQREAIELLIERIFDKLRGG